MSDLVWDDVRDFFDPDSNGRLPDVVIEGAGVDGWQAVLDLIRSQGWTYEYSEDGEILNLPSARGIFTPRGQGGSLLRVWPSPEIQMHFYPYGEDSIIFDVDLLELQGQKRLDLLCEVFRTLGRRLGKPVMMEVEGFGYPLIGYDVEADRAVLLADPPG